MSTRFLALPIQLALIAGFAVVAHPAGTQAEEPTSSAIPKEVAVDKNLLAMVNDWPVYVEDLERVLSDLHSRIQASSRPDFDVDSLIRNRLVGDALLAGEAAALAMDREAPIPKRLEKLRDDMARERLEYEAITSRVEIDESLIETIFESDYRTVTAHMATLKSREEAGRFLDEIRAGADFEALARERSVDGLRGQGGLAENFPYRNLPPEIAEVVFNLEPGSLSAPLLNELGWTVFRAESFAAADPQVLPTVEDRIRGILELRQADTLRAELLAELLAKHEPEIDNEAIAAIGCERRGSEGLWPVVPDPKQILVQIQDRLIRADACSTCHNPHGSDNAGLLQQPEKEMCLSCHGSSSFEGSAQHAAMDGGCLSCHAIHGSTEEQLLALPAASLCFECHDSGDGLRAAHGGLQPTGSQCTSCHSPHSGASEGLLLASVHPDLDCTSCHRDDSELANLPDAKICLDCHDPPTGSATSTHGPAAGGLCLDCHQPHTSATAPLLANSELLLCTSCHTEAEQFRSGSHPHAAMEQCTNCHSGHESNHPALLRTTERQLCLDCHGDPAGDVEVSHSPLEESCTLCHAPHGSGREGLLVARQDDLCGDCHGGIGARAGLRVLHEPVARGECTGCHTPHGGNTGLLLAQGKDLCSECHSSETSPTERQLHVPFEEGECATCHLPHGSDVEFLLTESPGRLCRTCHDTADAPEEGGSLHAPAANECSACHQPHASEREPLLRAAIPALCFTCHSDLGERLATETVHQPAGEPDGCLGCHGPHATAERNLLLDSESATCGQCHETGDTGFTADHLGFSGDGLECASCHDPHASLMTGLLQPQQHDPFAAGDCSACHEAVTEPSGGAQ